MYIPFFGEELMHAIQGGLTARELYILEAGMDIGNAMQNGDVDILRQAIKDIKEAGLDLTDNELERAVERDIKIRDEVAEEIEYRERTGRM